MTMPGEADQMRRDIDEIRERREAEHQVVDGRHFKEIIIDFFPQDKKDVDNEYGDDNPDDLLSVGQQQQRGARAGATDEEPEHREAGKGPSHWVIQSDFLNWASPELAVLDGKKLT